ncbi:2-nitropropane dioxygenase [Lasius niger]|uniref:2-nitropropane dioxygenase n=1 Tax=Lasius niger TaxID=67767 RepID=A0A0J7NP06_LASNI|nr:2-nitropropane dioxygenase [Lasius niger]
MDCLPLIEGGKGVAVSTGISAGKWAEAGGVGTLSAVNADSYDDQGNVIPQIYHSSTRRERQVELINYAIKGGIAQAEIAHELSGGNAPVHANFLWEMGGAEEVISGILEGSKGLIQGITCGAGMPYRLSEIASRFNVYYYPIVSSGRAFNALWKRSFSKQKELLGGVVYEDPWRAGGHNGLSNTENPLNPEDPYPRVLELRKVLNAYGLNDLPIIMAGGVWNLSEWDDWIDNKALGPVAFQFGTRPLLTKESPIPAIWKEKLRYLKKGDVFLNRFSPTGFYSSAVNNPFIQELRGRSERQVPFKRQEEADFTASFVLEGSRGREIFLRPSDLEKVQNWQKAGHTQGVRTPDATLIFVAPERAAEILQDQNACMGCLSQCHFSGWSQRAVAAGKPSSVRPDPRSFCIQKTLQTVAHLPNVVNEETTYAMDHNLMFGGTNAWRFAQDPFYADGFIPTVKELIEAIQIGK